MMCFVARTASVVETAKAATALWHILGTSAQELGLAYSAASLRQPKFSNPEDT